MNTEKKKLDHNAFEDLNDGIYELEKTQDEGILYSVPEQDVLEQFEHSAFYAPNYLRQMQKEQYLLEKREGRAVLFFSRMKNKKDFMDDREDYEDIIESFRDFTGCGKVEVIFSHKAYVAGLSTFAERPRWQDDFLTARIGSEIKPFSVIEDEYIGEDLGRYMQNALKRLTPNALLSYCEDRIQGQGIQLKKAVYLVYRYLLNIADGMNAPAENWMLTAPSGSGKTEFFRAVRDCFRMYNIPVPVVQIDLSQITETGFKGDNMKAIPQKILQASPNMGGVAICFLDEADKKFVPSYASHNVNVNAAVQANLLTLVEGTQLKVEVNDVDKDFDSEKTMFVFMGSFQSMRNDRQEKKDKTVSIGFGADFTGRDGVSQAGEEFYEDLTLQDMIDFGMQEELAGRMVQVINFRRLSREHMRKLITDKIEEISKEMGVAILFSDNAVEELLDISFGSLGIRRPMNVVRELVSNAVAEFFFDGGFDSVRDKVLIDSLESVKISKTIQKKGIAVQVVLSCDG